MQCEMPMVLTAQKTVEVPQLQFINKVVDSPVVAQRQISWSRLCSRTPWKIPQLQVLDKVVDLPVLAQRQIPMVQNVQQNRVEDSTGAGRGQGC